MNFDITEWSFSYQDYEYFEWLRNPSFDSFKNVIRWKGLNRRGQLHTSSLKNFWKADQIDLDRADILPLVSRAFLYHLSYPAKYPIIDRNVWTAMRDIYPDIAAKTKNITCRTWDKDYIGTYKAFFARFYRQNRANIKCERIPGIKQDLVKMRVLDRALWEYGRRLGRENRSTKQ